MNGVGYGITPFMGASGILARSSGGGGAFVNKYSMSFDGNLDYVNCGNDASRKVQTLTMSVWAKPTAFASDPIFLNGHPSYGNQGIEIFWNFNQFRVRINGTSYGLGAGSGQNNWTHIVISYDGNTLKRMTNGVANSDVVVGATINYTNYSGLLIGRSVYGYALGFIDEVAFWDSDQSANFSTIYNGGAPADLTSLSPLNWYRMGDGDSFSTNWTLIDNGSGGNDATSVSMPEEARLPISPNSYSQNSFVFDGASDFVTLGNPSSLRLTADFSISCWMKFTDSGATRYALSMGDQYGIYTSGGTIRGFARIGGAFTSLTSVGTFNDGNWHHVLYVKNATNMLLYIDGSLNASNTSGGTNTASTLDQRIGARYTNANYYEGSIDELYIFNSDQSGNISTIYGNGVPTDISSLNPLGHWRFGETDIFSTTWTFVDQGSGGNDATSSTLPEGAKTGDQPYVL